MPDFIERMHQAITHYQQGKMVILVDDVDRENEGDLIIAAEKVTPDAINFMSSMAKGLICMPMASELIEKLALPMMVQQNQSPYQTAFTVSIEAKNGVTTGISAHDRARTILTAIQRDVSPSDIVTPGHVFPLKAKDDGVLVRRGQTEGSVDLARLSGLTPAAVICEIINDDGTMAKGGSLVSFAKRHHLPIISVEDIYRYRIMHEACIRQTASTKIPLGQLGDFEMKVFSSPIDNMEHIALLKYPMSDKPIVRIHSECMTGDIFGSSRCDCGGQLNESLKRISEHGGVLLYLRQEGRGIGLTNKIKAYELQLKEGLDTVEANKRLGLAEDARDYAIAASILRFLKVDNIVLLTNNPRKMIGLEYYGLNIDSREPLILGRNKDNDFYLDTKKNKLGHLLG